MQQNEQMMFGALVVVRTCAIDFYSFLAEVMSIMQIRSCEYVKSSTKQSSQNQTKLHELSLSDGERITKDSGNCFHFF